MMTDKFFLKNKINFLRDSSNEDNLFIYNLVEDFLKSDLSVTFLSLPLIDEFFKIKIKRYIISNGKESLGFVQILENNEVGYFLEKKFQNKGIGTECVELLMKLNPRKRFFATINNKNESSTKLIKSLGFKPKATIYEKIIDS